MTRSYPAAGLFAARDTAASMPIRFETVEGQGPVDVRPGGSGSLNGVVTVYEAWEAFEIHCDDFESPGYSWSIRADFTIDG